MKMIAKDKEHLFALLRSYHEAPTLQSPSSAEVGAFIREIQTTADKIISMMLGLVRGTAHHKDWAPDLNRLDMQMESKPIHTKTEQSERKLLREKIAHLRTIVALAPTE